MLKLDTTPATRARWLAQYSRSKNPKFDAAFLGSTQAATQRQRGDQLGLAAVLFSEVSKTGKVLLYARWPDPDVNYRVYVQKWTGTPSFAPNGAVRTSHGKTTVYASWDGATEVVAWRVLAGKDASHLATVATRAKNGFETAIALTSSFKKYKVQALDSKGHVLRTSGVFPQSGGSGTSQLPQGY